MRYGLFYLLFPVLSLSGGDMEYGKLRIFYSTAIDSFDPMQSDRFDLMFYHKNIYATLVSNFRLGKIEPMVAESWQVSEDGKEWIFKIREGLKFTNGESITAKAVYESFKRFVWLTRNNKTRFQESLYNIEKWENYKHNPDFIKLDNNKIVFKFSKRPYNLFETISQPMFSIVHSSCYDENGNWKDKNCYIGSGQYEIVERNENRLLLRNRHIYPEVNNSPEYLEIVYISEYGNNYLSAIIDNKADFTIAQSFEFEYEIREKLKQKKFIITSRPKLNMRFIELNYRKAPFNNKELRQTVRDFLLYEMYKEKDYEIDPSFIPKGGIGYLKFGIKKPEIKKKYEIDDKVQFLKLKTGLNLTKKVYSIMSKILAKLNIKSEDIVMDKMGIFLNRRKNGEFDVMALTSGILIVDPWADLRLMFMSDVGARIPDPSGRIHLLVEKADKTTNPENRRKIAEEINRIIYDEAAVITYIHTSMDYVHRDFIDLSEVNLFSDPIEFRCISVNK